jgi:hypothetical protein
LLGDFHSYNEEKKSYNMKQTHLGIPNIKTITMVVPIAHKTQNK